MAAGAARGVAFIASSGDEGNECFTGGTPQYQPGAGWPASNPNVIAAGGTQTDGFSGESLTDAVVWNDKIGAGSGGVSAQYAIPAYQTASLLANCLSPANGGSPCSSTKRNVPDISMPAACAAVEINGKWQPFDGTSWSSPQYAALMAEIYQYCKAAAGIANPVTIPYYVYAQYRFAFIDVTSGTDQYASTTPFYSAGIGFDDASGLGVPLGTPFAQAVCPNRSLASGFLTRSASMAVSAAAQYPAQARTLDITPRMRGLFDEGARSDVQQTRVQLVVSPGADAAAGEAAIVTALEGSGFTITQRFSNHLVIDAVAPAGVVNRFFRTSLHNVSQARYGMRYMPATQIVVPSAIAPYVAGVSLDNVVKFHTALH
jgi:subtilase family serine protease